MTTFDQPRMEAAAQSEKDGAHDLADCEAAWIVHRLCYAEIDPVLVPKYLTVERVFDRGPDRNPRFVLQELERADALPGETAGDITARAEKLVREWESLVTTKLRAPRDVRLEIPDGD